MDQDILCKWCAPLSRTEQNYGSAPMQVDFWLFFYQFIIAATIYSDRYTERSVNIQSRAV